MPKDNIVETLMSEAGGSDSSSRSKAVLDKLAERLTQQGQGISTSSSSGIQSEIEKAMADVGAAGEATYQRLQSEHSREKGFAEDRASANITAAREGQTGYAQQIAGLNELTRTTEKSIRDLDQRYQESIMANDANTATQLASLRIEKLNFLDKQEQNFYSNLFSLAGLAQQEDANKSENERFWAGKKFEEQMFDKQMFKEERNNMLALAAEHGVEVADGDTIESIIKKVSPFVDKKKALELRELETSIERNRAEISAALAGERDAADFDDFTAKAFAASYLQGNKDIMVGLKTPNQAKKVMSEIESMKKDSENAVKDIISNSTDAGDFKRKIMDDERVIPGSIDIDLIIGAYESEWNSNASEARKKEKEKKREEARNYFSNTGGTTWY